MIEQPTVPRAAAGHLLGWCLVVVALVVALAAPAGAQLKQLPRPTGYVNDFANVIPPEEERRILQIVEEVRAKSGGEIVVVTLPSLEGRGRDEVALQILREWGVGASTGAGDSLNNTGSLIMVAPSDRDYKIELGYGTNTFVTAGEAGRIGRLMVPAFQRGQFGEGILLATHTLALQYGERFGFEVTGQAPAAPVGGARRTGQRSNFSTYVVIAIILFFLLSNRGGGGRGGRGRRRRGFGGPVIIPFPMGGGGWGGGGFGGGGFGGGGFGGFGGGGGGGGGAGGSW